MSRTAVLLSAVLVLAAAGAFVFLGAAGSHGVPAVGEEGGAVPAGEPAGGLAARGRPETALALDGALPTGSGRLRGRVTDAGGRPLADVSVLAVLQGEAGLLEVVIGPRPADTPQRSASV